MGNGVRDEGQRVCGSSVLGQSIGIQIEISRILVDHDVLQHCAEGLRTGVDLGLGLRAEANHLRVAASFEVEYAIVAPAVFVIADEAARGIGRERRLSGSAQAEENGGVSLLSDVGRAVHRHHRFLREQVIQDREYRFFHFAGVAGSADEDQSLGKIEQNEGLRVGVVLGRIRR